MQALRNILSQITRLDQVDVGSYGLLLEAEFNKLPYSVYMCFLGFYLVVPFKYCNSYTPQTNQVSTIIQLYLLFFCLRCDHILVT